MTICIVALCENMEKNINYAFWSKACMIGGASVMLLAFLTVIIVVITTGSITLDKIEPMAIPISLGIALYSVGLALDSNVKMIANANESFLKIVDTFEDKRIQFLQHPDWLGIEGTIWKCQTYLDRAIKLKKSSKIAIDNQNKLFYQFDLLINRTGLPWGTDVIKPSDFKNIHKMESKFLELDLTDEYKGKLKRIKEYVKKFESPPTT